MKIKELTRAGEFEWRIEPTGRMRVPAILYADERLLDEMDDKVRDQLAGVAALPGIVRAALAMPDAHWGYGFPIGGVGAFDPEQDGIVSAGGVGFDLSCGVRLLLTGLVRDELMPRRQALADALFREVPAGVGSTGRIRLTPGQLDDMLAGGARWAVGRGWGVAADLARIESGGVLEDADPAAVSAAAKQRQTDEMGTLGSGNHYLELQEIVQVYDDRLAAAFNLRPGEVCVSIHCGSRGLGHQVATDYSRRMVRAAAEHGIQLTDRELACAPIRSDIGRAYLGAMNAAANCALANREILGHLVRGVFARVFPGAELPLLFDVSHNLCRREEHAVDGRRRVLYVHRKGATRSLGPGHPELPPDLRAAGQPVLVGGTMGTASYVMRGTELGMKKTFGSGIHGAGRALSRKKAATKFWGEEVVSALRKAGIRVFAHNVRGVAEEAPGAYKDVERVVDAAQAAGLNQAVARLRPMAVIKG